MAMNPENPGYGGKNPSSTSPGPEGGGNLHFRCADIHSGCSWEARGRDETELRQQIERHGREQHGMKDFSEDIWNRVRNTFRRAA